jgi:chitin synthase
METLHTIGLVLFVFAVLPSLNVVRGAMLSNCLCVLPGLLAMLSRQADEKWLPGKILLDLLALAGQLSAFVHWTWIEPLPVTQESSSLRWMLPVSCIFISCGWWENFAGDYSRLRFIRGLARMKESLHRSRYFIHVLVAPLKMILMVSGMFAVRYHLDGGCLYLLSQFRNAFSSHKVLVVRERAEVLGDGIDAEWLELDSFGSTALWFVFVQLAATWLCYVFGKFACKICIQGFSFTLPLLLAVPLCIIVFSVTCDMHLSDTCALAHALPRHLFWTCPSEPGNGSFISIENVLWIVWIMSQIWICIHICRPRCERLATTEKLFINPMYCSAFIDQSMMMNRRRDDLIVFKFKLDDDDPESVGVYAATDRAGDSSGTSTHYESIQDGHEDRRGYAEYRKKGKEKSVVQEEDYTTRLLICATMWHETKEEMLQMLKSLIRLDEDQCAKKNAKQFFNAKIQDYYEFEGKFGM